MNEDPKKQPSPRESLGKGFSEVFKAASSIRNAVKRETKKAKVTNVGSNLGRALDDASREIVRAASNVASFVGGELTEFGKRAQKAFDEEQNAAAAEGANPEESQAAGSKKDDDDWPKTREEYEKKYGRDGDDWPKSREEYEKKYGRPPRKRGDDDDPGFRIA
ncbi:MAG: hypothetical protein U0271_06535 [Polyangiaceae bacterium]